MSTWSEVFNAMASRIEKLAGTCALLVFVACSSAGTSSSSSSQNGTEPGAEGDDGGGGGGSSSDDASATGDANGRGEVDGGSIGDDGGSSGGNDGAASDASADAGASCTSPTMDWMHDGVKDCGETDVDCGGTSTTKCAIAKACASGADCVSNACNYANVCAGAVSCTAHLGGDTCGQGEVGDPTAKHEDCCVALPIPLTTHTPKRDLDKYAVTAGRMRVFLNAVAGNVQGWVQANRATLAADVQATLPASSDAYLPTSNDGVYGVVNQLNGYIYAKNRPSDLQGCYIAGNGTHTYWFPDDVEIANGDFIKDKNGNPIASHAYTQDQLDPKALNCVIEPLAAAFCAWDGGRLQYRDEADSAYGPGLYPWGATPIAGGFQGSATIIGPAASGHNQTEFTNTPCPTCNTTLINWSHDYMYPAPDSTKPSDYSYYLAAPGRFAGDKGPYGHMDVAANLILLTASQQGTQDGLPSYQWTKNGSWEGHNVGNDSYSFDLLTKYGKTGLRCAR